MVRLLLLLAGLIGTTACSAKAPPIDSGRVVATSTDELAERQAIVDRVEALIGARDYAGLSAMEDGFRESRERTPSGVWKLSVWHNAVRYFLSDGLTAEEGCAYRRQDSVRAWLAARPDSAAPVITQAALLAAQGWCIRGGRYASEVPQEAWPRFHALIDQSFRLLVSHKAMAVHDPAYHAVLVDLLRARGVPREQFMEAVSAAADREPYYYDTYFEAAHYFLPQWHGSWADLHDFARYAAARTRTSDRDGVYARIFWSLDQCECQYLERGADRTLLRQAMRDVFERYPNAWNATRFGEYSCRLGDAEEGKRYLRAAQPDAPGEHVFAAQFASCDLRARMAQR